MSRPMNNALTQYTDLHDQAKAQLEASAGAPVNRLRAQARQALEGDRRLPDTHTEGYEKTSINDMFAPDYGVNINRVGIPVDIASTFRCDVPNLSTLQATVVNDRFVPSARLDERLPEGVRLMSLARASVEMPDLVARYYGRLAPLTDTPVALNTMMVQDGVLVYVAAGVRPDRALQLVNIFSSPAPLAAFRRLLVVVEDDAELTLLTCDHTQDNTKRYLASQVIEIFAGCGSRVELCSIEESSPLTSRHSMLYLSQQAGSHVAINTTTLTCGSTRNDFHITLDGEHCECLLSGMAIGGDDMHIDNDTAVIHTAPHCHSNQLFKYVMDDRSSGAFEGSITVQPTAPFTEAYQSDRNLLASGEARMHCKPQLIINNDEVKCSHGATTGQLDEDALFYMRQRGIPLDEARRMLMQAFMADVIDSVHIAGLQERLRHLVERRFSGTLGHCESCKGECQ
ncbi:MAG: Fe-S cluster assembly protein SufD [Duncaniella sp.]|nr:Fe-S cluster assembly protein SufD [Duncaniella sp.]